jgi:hypothetical protein
MVTICLEDTAASPTRRRAQAWRSFFLAPCASLRPCWMVFLRILRAILTPTRHMSGSRHLAQQSSLSTVC